MGGGNEWFETITEKGLKETMMCKNREKCAEEEEEE